MNPQERLIEALKHFMPFAGMPFDGAGTPLSIQVHDKFGTPECYGDWYAEPGTIHVYIYDKLPPEAKAFVLDHELFHAFDHETNWIKRELRANLYAARHNPKGFFIVLWKTITSKKRLAYYWWRVRNGR
jgi:hypothetical protein